MNTIPSSSPSDRQKFIQTSALLGVVVALAAAFWSLTSSTAARAGSATCQVCHKFTTTLTFDCSELNYQRHIDHGDPMGPCSATREARDGKAQ